MGDHRHLHPHPLSQGSIHRLQYYAGTKTHLGHKIYLGDADASDDLGKRCLITKSAMETAYSKVALMAAKRCSRYSWRRSFTSVPGRGYPVSTWTASWSNCGRWPARASLRTGSSVTAPPSLPEEREGLCAEHAGHTAGPPYDKLRVTTGKDNASIARASSPENRIAVLGGIPDSNGIKPTVNVVIQSAAWCGGHLRTCFPRQHRRRSSCTVLLTQPSDKSEVFNVALVQKGGAAGSGTGLREAIIYKEYVSPIDFLGPNYGDDLFHTDGGR